ncbi:MAG: hypothetical protein K1X94_26760, partial [Sandaracinaceae bacterium]|nr:hypothetical protein [Sandaracinaceae bacterium]
MSEPRPEPIDLVPPRRVHRGSVLAAGVFVARDDAAARATILAQLAPGDGVERFEKGLYLRRARVVRVEAESLFGDVVIEDRGLLTTAPLSRAEHAAAIDRSARLVRASGGALEHPRAGTHVDPSTWLDVSELELEIPGSLGAPPAPIREVEAARGAREALGVIEGSLESAALRRALLGAAAEPRPGARPTQSAGPSALASRARGATLAQRWASRALSVVSFLRRLFGARAPRRAALPATSGQPAGAPPRSPSDALGPPRPPGLFARIEAWLRDRMRRLGWDAFGRYLARKHAEHLKKLLELLEGHDLDAALRHAIPLSEDKGDAGPPSLSLPAVRSELAISIQRARGGGGALGVDRDLFAHLRERYRVLYQRLLEKERWRDAAFVLAELLDDALGAVALLEKHGFLREAAELAEGRRLAPPIVVRQWILARELRRAVSIARRHDAFGPAIARLRNHPEMARALALAWGDHRARSGDYLGALAALETGQAVEPARGLAVRWAERALEVGGVQAGEAIVWLLELDGGAPARVGPRLEALLRDPSPAERHVRAAVYAALVRRRDAAVLALHDAAR